MDRLRHLLVLVTCLALLVGPQCCCCTLAGGVGGAAAESDGGACCCCAASADAAGSADADAAAHRDAAPGGHDSDRPCRCRDSMQPAALAGHAFQAPSGACEAASWGPWDAALAASLPALEGAVVPAACQPAADEPPPRSGRALLRACGILRL
jgi:hypothetical protein